MDDRRVVIRVPMKDNIESLNDSELQEIINDFDNLSTDKTIVRLSGRLVAKR